MTRHLASHSRLALLALTATAMVRCSGDDDPKPLELDRTQAMATAKENTRSTVAGMLTSSGSAGLAKRVNETFESASIGCDDDGSCDPFLSDEAEGDAEEALQELLERVFDPANVHQETDTRITLRLRSSVMCAPDLESSCVRVFDQLPIFVELTSVKEGDIDAKVFVGDDRIEVMTLALHHKEVVVELSLEGAHEAALRLASVLEEDTTLPDIELRGSILLALKETAPEAYLATLGFPTGLFAKVPGDHGVVEIDLEASPSASVLSLDGNTKIVRHTADLNRLAFSFPLTEPEEDPDCLEDPAFCDDRTDKAIGQVSARLAGLKGEIEVKDGEDSIALRGMGLGQDALRLFFDGQPIASLAINPNAGRVFDAILEAAGEDMEITVQTKLEAFLDLSFGNLPESLEVPAWTKNEQLSVSLDGSSTPSVLVLGERDDDADDLASLKVVSGRLTMSATQAGTQVVVEAGQCLFGPDDGDDDNGADASPFEGLRADACE